MRAGCMHAQREVLMYFRQIMDQRLKQGRAFQLQSHFKLAILVKCLAIHSS